IGGQRLSAIDGTQLEVAAENVEGDAGVHLIAPEIMLAARDTVRIKDGASIEAKGDVTQTDDVLLLSGDSGFLRVSQPQQAQVLRASASGLTGTIAVRPDARLIATKGSVAADASLDTISIGQLDIEDGSLSLGASLITLGAPPGGTGGLFVDTEALESLGLRELVLTSRSTIDGYGDTSLDATDLPLKGPGPRAGPAR